MKILKDFVIRPRKVILGHEMMLKSSGQYSGFLQNCFHIVNDCSKEPFEIEIL